MSTQAYLPYGCGHHVEMFDVHVVGCSSDGYLLRPFFFQISYGHDIFMLFFSSSLNVGLCLGCVYLVSMCIAIQL